MSTVAIIPARGGSKSIPKKNIQPFASRPLVAYSIEQALVASKVDRVVVSTDDDDIARVARAYGAEVVVRPPELSSDKSPSEEALIHVLETLEASEGYLPELVVFLQPTSPLRDEFEIDEAIETLHREAADSLFSAYRPHGFLWKIRHGVPESVSYDFKVRPRRQEADEEIVENGSIYVFKPWVLKQNRNRLGGKITFYLMDPLHSFQIDSPVDLRSTEQIAAVVRHWPSRHELREIRAVALDFDGVMTDNRVLVSQEGVESVWCNRGDGWGVARLKEAGIAVVVLSTELNDVVSKRCSKLGVECIQGLADKLGALKTWASQHSFGAHTIAYIGNDANDVGCLEWVGAPIVVADAFLEARRVAKFVTSRPGGWGSVREVAGWILDAQAVAPALGKEAP